MTCSTLVEMLIQSLESAVLCGLAGYREMMLLNAGRAYALEDVLDKAYPEWLDALPEDEQSHILKMLDELD